MNNPKISIVLPCYNGAKLLDLAIESVLSQTFTNWELIIVNDCSTDNTLEIAQSYADKDSRIRVFSNAKNSKIPATLNHGFREARGDYWTWTSDDNILLPDFCQEMNDYLDTHPEIGFVVSDYENIDVNGKVIGISGVPDDIQQKIPANNYVGASFMYRRTVAQKAGEYSEDFFLVEDYEYWLRLSGYTKMAHLPKVLYQYRHHSGSLSSTRKKEVAERLVSLRLTYLDKVEKALIDSPEYLSLFYYRIVDNLRGGNKWRYFIRFTGRLPYWFGLRYIFIHLPHRFVKNVF